MIFLFYLVLLFLWFVCLVIPSGHVALEKLIDIRFLFCMCFSTKVSLCLLFFFWEGIFFLYFWWVTFFLTHSWKEMFIIFLKITDANLRRKKKTQFLFLNHPPLIPSLLLIVCFRLPPAYLLDKCSQNLAKEGKEMATLTAYMCVICMKSGVIFFVSLLTRLLLVLFNQASSYWPTYLETHKI